jgi:hypothetical protein
MPRSIWPARPRVVTICGAVVATAAAAALALSGVAGAHAAAGAPRQAAAGNRPPTPVEGTPTLPVTPDGPIVTASTRHLDLAAALSTDTVSPGARISAMVDIIPKPGMHVYAPGAEYRVIEMRLMPNALIRAEAPTYPASEIYYFEPLDEHVPVYKKPFRIVRDLVVAPAAEQQRELRKLTSLTIDGVVDYQACDDKICYLPASVPFKWTVAVKAAVAPAAGR